MVVASILGLSLSFVPCLLIGIIMLISFLLCNCEYIGETVAKYFCTNKRKITAQLEYNGKSNKSLKGGGKTNKSGQMRETELCSSSSSRPIDDDNQEYALTLRKNIPGNGYDLMDEVEHSEFDGAEVASAPSLSPSHSVRDLIDFDEESTSPNDADGSDPPPSYDECLRDKYRRD